MRNSFRTRARLWLYLNDDFVQLSLDPGQTIHWGKSHPTDEGYSFTTIELSYDGEIVELEERRGGRDCDGRIEMTYRYACSLDNLHADPIDIKLETIYRPAWDKELVRVYDEYAQLSNY